MSKEITRREALKVLGQIVFGSTFSSLSSGCTSTEQPQPKALETSLAFQPTPLSTSSEQPTPRISSTATLETKPTLSPETTVFPQTQLTSEFVKQGFVGIGGGEEEVDLGAISSEKEERKIFSWQTVEGYTSLAWNEEISLEDLVKDEIKAVKALVALGAQAGVEGFYQPGEVLPQFKDLTFLRVTIEKLPNNQDFLEVKLNAFPQNFILRKGTHLTVLGLWANESGRWAIVAFDEGFDREKPGFQPREVPRQYLAIIPQDLPAEAEGLSLERLLNANNYLYQAGTVEHLGDNGNLYHQELNIIEPILAKELEKEAGALFMDQKPNGSWYENPIVPYPPQEQTSIHTVKSGETLSKIAQEYNTTIEEILKANPQIKDPSKIFVGQEITIIIPGFTNFYGPTITQDGRVVILSPDQKEEIGQAFYDEREKEWNWTRLAIIAPTPTLAPTPTKKPTPEPTKPSEQFPEKRPSFLDEVGWREEIRTEVMGFPVSVDIVTGKTLQERDWFAIEKIVLNKEYYPDAEQRVGEIVMRAHWHAWVNDNPEERKNVSFEEYMTRLKNGEDLSYEAVVSAEYLTGTVRPKDPVRIDPRKPVELVYTDKSQMIYIAEGISYSLAVDKNKLYICAKVLVPDPKEDIETYLDYYTSYLISNFDGLLILSLSNDFQKEGGRLPKNWSEKDRLRWCGEFADIDNLRASCDEDKVRNVLKFNAVLRAVLVHS
jgi:LysM repeat protein